ncbi:acid-sensing ion channel 1C-like [Haliotis rubra]|uniref:acid-sensing ion channel 1C-like n=1 Tax=Haliotis rubra TaxID=36100 RepID=UPI001EE59D31|nr:acid-sensing ion channel 1C-like [Haliotis rubra]
MAGYLSYNLTKELINYYSYPVITNTKLDVHEELPFPAVTFCNLSPYNLTRVRAVDPYLEEYFAKTSLFGPYIGPINWSDPGYGSTFQESHNRDWWKNIYMSLTQMFSLCWMNGMEYHPCTLVMKPILTHMGQCATFNWNASDAAKVRLTGSDNGLVMHADIGHANYVLGSQLAAGMKYQYMPPPYQAFKNRTCLDTSSPSFTNTLQYFDVYTYENCLQECITLKTHDRCGCIRPADNATIGKICSIYTFTTCYDPVYGYFMQNVEILQSCGCQVPCSFETYDVKVSTARFPSNVTLALAVKLGFAPDETFVRENLLEIRVFYENLIVQSTEQTPQYSTETLIGNLGGQMGICLGASILTLTELGEFLLKVCLTIFKKRRHGGRIEHTNVSHN